jgi:hypothetical protein
MFSVCSFQKSLTLLVYRTELYPGCLSYCTVYGVLGVISVMAVFCVHIVIYRQQQQLRTAAEQLLGTAGVSVRRGRRYIRPAHYNSANYRPPPLSSI